MERRRNVTRTLVHSDGGGGGAPDRLQVHGFGAVPHRIGQADRSLLHELTVGVVWPHRPHDLDMLIKLGDGYLATDEIGRAMGSAMCFKADEGFAMLGMMVTAPRLQTHGTGRWLLKRVMGDCDGIDLRLSATRSGYRLYESAGFQPYRTIFQYQGKMNAIEAPALSPGVILRPLEDGDQDAIRTLDAHAYGAKRSRALTELLRLSQGMVAEVAGEVRGFALIRPFGRGMVIGPLVAEDEDTAIALAAKLIEGEQGNFVRLDTPVKSDRFNAFLNDAGMALYDTVTEMYLGQQRRPEDGAQLFGLAAHSLG